MSEHVFKVSIIRMHTWFQITPALMMFRSKSKQVCIKHFRRSSMSWIFVSCMLCCTTPNMSKFKAHHGPGPLWWSYDAFGNIPLKYCISVFWFSQGSVAKLATLIRWGGWNTHRHVCRSFLSLTVKTALKSLIFHKVTDKNKLAPVYGPRCRTVITYYVLSGTDDFCTQSRKYFNRHSAKIMHVQCSPHPVKTVLC